MLSDMEKLGGGSESRQAVQLEIAELEERVLALIVKCRKLRENLVEAKVYKPLEKLVKGFGLDFKGFSNSSAVVARLVAYSPTETDDFDGDHLQVCVSLVSMLAEKAQAETELNRLRLIGIGVAQGITGSPPSTEAAVEPKLLTSLAEDETESPQVETGE